ncbi:MAG: thiamine pyrophosphate-dependent enzyme [Pseudomonadota bacterium]
MNERTPAELMSGGEAMVAALLDRGVDTVFGIPGIQLDPLFDAFHAKRNQVRMIHTRHEQGAAFMAMGYAQASGRTGVFAVVPGPGLLNAAAALSTAVAANTPVLGITGQIPSYQIGLNYGMAHELADQLAMSRGIVGFAERAEHPTEVPGLIDAAFQFMHGGRNKPAVIEMAPDQYAARAPVVVDPPRPLPDAPVADPGRVQAMAERLEKARCPAMFVGGGVIGAEAQLVAMAERLAMPIVYSPSALGAIDYNHPLAIDLLSAQTLWDELDVALVVGTRFIAPALAWGRAEDIELLRIDIDPTQIVKPRPAAIALTTSAAAGLDALLEALGPGRADDAAIATRVQAARAEMGSKLAEIGDLPAFSDALRRVLPRDGIVVTDVTQFAYFTRFGFPVYEPRTWLAPGYQATLGYGYPAALGARLACPERKVVAICGDGGFMFTAQELATAVHHNIPVVAIVVDNGAYGNVKTIQKQSFGARHIAVELSNPDFVAMAESFGMTAARAETPAEFETVLSQFIDLERPTLIHVPMGEVPSIWDLVKRPPSQGRAQ